MSAPFAADAIRAARGRARPAHQAVRSTSTGRGRRPRTAKRPFANGLAAAAWLALGLGGLALDSRTPWGGPVHATMVLSGLATLFGVWVFWRHGGGMITAIGIYNFAFALFVGFSGLYLATTAPAGILPGPLRSAVAWCYFLQVVTWLLFWTKDPSPVPDEVPEADPMVTRWAVGLGLLMLLGAVLVSLISMMSAQQALLVDATGFIGTVLIGLGLPQSSWRHRWMVYGMVIAAAFAVYMRYLFDGFGRIVLGSLGFALFLILAQRTRGRLAKSTVLIGAAPVLLALAKLRDAGGPRPGTTVHGNGLESVVSPLQSFASLLDHNNLGMLPYGWGHTFWAALVALVPSSVWSGKPVGFGAELVPILNPELVGTGQSDAALFAGEWLFNFGLPGLLLMVPAAGLAIRGLDHVLARSMSLPIDSRRAVVRYSAAVVAAAGLIDLMWVGSFTYVARTGSRLLILAAVFVILAWRTKPPQHAGKPSQHAGSAAK